MKRVALACLLVLVALAAWHPASQAAPADPAAPAFVPDEVLVQYREGATDAQRGAARGRVNGVPVRQLRAPQAGEGGLELVRLRGMDVRGALARLQADPSVEFAEPNYILTRGPLMPTAVSNDRGATNGSHWGLYGEQALANCIPEAPYQTCLNEYGSQATEAWANDFTGKAGVYVGVIDEGIQFNHCDLRKNVWTNPGETGTYTGTRGKTYDKATDGKDNDGNGYADDVHGWDFYHNDGTIYDAGEDDHGTHVSGTIGSAANNSCAWADGFADGGDVGVNWDVTLISGKFLGPDGGSLSDAIRAVDYFTALKTKRELNIVALNNSWGGGGYSIALHAAIIRAANANILFIAAAGNAGKNNDTTASYPCNYNTTQSAGRQAAANYDSVICVAALAADGTIPWWTNYGSATVDLGAPGVGIWSTVPGGYAEYSGTSMATPHVTGAAALYASVNPSATGAQIRTALLNTAKTRPTPSLSQKTVTNGRLDISCLQHPDPTKGALGNCIK